MTYYRISCIILKDFEKDYAPIVQWIEHQPSKLVTRVRFPLGVRTNLIFKIMEDNKNEEGLEEKELTEEEIAKMDELFGFGGCDCEHCGHKCGEEETEEDNE